MNQPKQHHNRLDIYRRRMGFTLFSVARRLGHRDASTVSDYERGERLPSLVNAFRLSIILRTPVEFLFPVLFDTLRNQIRAEEEHQAVAADVQQLLF